MRSTGHPSSLTSDAWLFSFHVVMLTIEDDQQSPHKLYTCMTAMRECVLRGGCGTWTCVFRCLFCSILSITR